MHATFVKDKLDSNCMFLQVDFTMAYSYEYQIEIQSALLPRRSVNLFTAATYNAEDKEEPFLIVTNSPDKGKNSVCTFIFKLVDEMTFKDERELIFYLDGSSSGLKNNS